MSSLFSANGKSWQNLLITLVGIVVLGVAQPWIWGYVKQGAEQFQARRTQEQQLTELTTRLERIEAKHTEAGPALEQLAIAFPKSNATSQVVDRLEQLSDKLGVDLAIQNIGPDTTSKKQLPLVPTVVSVQVKGKASSLLQYIDSVEHLQEVAQIQTWDLSVSTTPAVAPGAPSPGPTFTLVMNILFYLQP